MDNLNLSPILIVCGAIGPFLGILVGHFLTRSWQQKQWMLDRRKEEWRELLTTLTRSFVTICKYGPMSVLDSDDMRAVDEAQTVAQTTIRDRVFIAREVKELNISETWAKAARAFEKDRTFMPFAEQYALINARIVDAATKDL